MMTTTMMLVMASMTIDEYDGDIGVVDDVDDGVVV